MPPRKSRGSQQSQTVPLRRSKRKASSPPPLPPPKSTVNEPAPDIQAIPPLAEAIATAVAQSVQIAVTAGIKAALKDSSGGVLNDPCPSSLTTEAVDPVINDLMGVGKLPACIIEDNDVSTEYQSVSLPLDARVSQRIRDKSWSNQYVDLAMLNDSGQEAEYAMKLNHNGAISLTPVSKGKKVRDIAHWVSLFHICMAVYLGRFLELSIALVFSKVLRILVRVVSLCYEVK